MSTPNIVTDAMIAKPLSVLNPAPAGWAMARLASIHLISSGSVTTNGIALSTTNGLDPDAIEIGGDMTTTDFYPGTVQPVGGGAGGCQQVRLDMNSPAVYRLLGGITDTTKAAKQINNAFQPASNANATFIIRVLDRSLHTQYVATCPGAGAATGYDGTTLTVNISAATPILTAQQAPSSAIAGLAQVWVNPVQMVRWEIMPASAEPQMFQNSPLSGTPLAPTTADDTKYDLVRSYVDANSGQVIASTTEIVAEYAVDLKFGFSVETGTTLLPSIVTYPLEDESDNDLWAQDVSLQAQPSTTGPQRIRSVRARIATRTALADRALNVPVPGLAGSYLYRYCLLNACVDPNPQNILQYARVRTVVTEAAMPNQSLDYSL